LDNGFVQQNLLYLTVRYYVAYCSLPQFISYNPTTGYHSMLHRIVSRPHQIAALSGSKGFFPLLSHLPGRWARSLCTAEIPLPPPAVTNIKIYDAKDLPYKGIEIDLRLINCSLDDYLARMQLTVEQARTNEKSVIFLKVRTLFRRLSLSMNMRVRNRYPRTKLNISRIQRKFTC
jgi:hypothetical protein